MVSNMTNGRSPVCSETATTVILASRLPHCSSTTGRVELDRRDMRDPLARREAEPRVAEQLEDGAVGTPTASGRRWFPK